MQKTYHLSSTLLVIKNKAWMGLYGMHAGNFPLLLQYYLLHTFFAHSKTNINNRMNTPLLTNR